MALQRSCQARKTSSIVYLLYNCCSAGKYIEMKWISKNLRYFRWKSESFPILSYPQLTECFDKLKQPPISTHSYYILNETIQMPAITICREPAYKEEVLTVREIYIYLKSFYLYFFILEYCRTLLFTSQIWYLLVSLSFRFSGFGRILYEFDI